jgi:hypothetical protein
MITNQVKSRDLDLQIQICESQKADSTCCYSTWELLQLFGFVKHLHSLKIGRIHNYNWNWVFRNAGFMITVQIESLESRILDHEFTFLQISHTNLATLT